MRPSLVRRLLGMSLAVAVLAVAATAWLTTADTGRRLQHEYAASIETDSQVYGELLVFAAERGSWDGVDSLVRRLAEQIGRRVTLIEVDRGVIADSAAPNAPALSGGPVARLEPDGVVPAWLHIGGQDRFDPFSDGGWLRTALTAAAVLLAAAGLTVVVGRRVTRPVRLLTEAAQRMGAGNHSARVEVRGDDEVARLGAAFNAMASSMEAARRSRESMTADVAHELRNPLANLTGQLEAAQDGVVALDDDLVASLREETTHLTQLVEDLAVLAMADAGQLRLHPEPTDVTDIARKVVAGNQPSAARKGITLSAVTAKPAVTVTDPLRLRQALGNLVVNAVRYTNSGGHVTVTVHTGHDDIRVEVADNGPGIAAEHLPHLFDRFYRAEKSRTRGGGGSGLGLAITRGLVEAAGGSVEAVSVEGQGSRFTIRDRKSVV